MSLDCCKRSSLKDPLLVCLHFLKYRALHQGEEEEEERLEECAEPKLMNLFGYEGELKAMQPTPRYVITCQNHRAGNLTFP